MKADKALLIIVAGTVWASIGCNTPSSPPAQSVPRPQSQVIQPQYPDEQATDLARQRKSGRHQHTTASPGMFDYYLLTLSWSPEFCVSHPQAAECNFHPAFVLHGLWPENLNGTYPENCSSAPGPGNPGAFRDIFPDLHLLQHEWQTHGTCSGLSPNAYFIAARTALHEVAIPAALSTVKTPIQLAPEQIITDFAQANPGYSATNFAVTCGNNRLTAVEVCLGKDLRAVSCAGVHSCGARTIKITPPGATSDQ